MSNRITAIAASALAFAFGCEQPMGSEPQQAEDQIVGQQEETRQQGGTEFNQEPQQDQMAQAEQQRRQQQQRHQQQASQGQQSPGQVVTEKSEHNLNRTLSQLNRQMRQNDLDVVATVRYSEQQRQRAMREQGEQAQQGQQAQQQGGEIGDVRMLLFRDTAQESRAIASEGPESLLKAPRAILVYEQGEDVIVSYQTPEEMAATGGEEPTAERLQRIVQASTQPRGQQQASAEQQQEQQEQQARAEQQRQEQQAQRGQEEGQQGQEQQAQAEQQSQEQQAQADQQERERQARLSQQRQQSQGMN